MSNAWAIGERYNMNSQLRDNYKEIETIPERTPSLVHLRKKIEERKDEGVTPHFAVERFTRDVNFILGRWDGRLDKWREKYPTQLSWLDSLSRGARITWKEDINSFVFHFIDKPKVFVRMGRVTSFLDKLVEDEALGFSKFEAYLISSRKAASIGFPDTLEDFLLSAASGGQDIQSCHCPKGDSEFSFGQWVHLLNPSVLHIFTHNGAKNDDGTIRRYSRQNVFSLWERETGKHFFLLSREYATSMYGGIIEDAVRIAAREMEVTVVTRANSPSSLSYGEDFSLPSPCLPRFYADVGEYFIHHKGKVQVVISLSLPGFLFPSPYDFKEGERLSSSREVELINSPSGERCEGCDGELGDEYETDPDGNHVCSDCFVENCLICECCEEATWRRDAQSYHGLCFCEECFDEKFTACKECGDPYPIDEMREGDGDLYCEACFQNNFQECIRCGEGVPNDEAKEEDGEWFCPHCWKREMRKKRQMELNIEKEEKVDA